MSIDETVLRQNTNESTRLTATIASGESVSAAIRVSKIGPRGFAAFLPTAWTAADLGIDVSDAANPSSESDWSPACKSDCTRIKITNIPTSPTQSLYADFPFEAWKCGAVLWIRLVSLNTSNEANKVNQGAQRTIVVKVLS